MQVVFEFTVIATTLWAFLWRFVPWATKQVCLYDLHGLREDIYAAGDDFPAARETLLYRDAEFLVTYAICVVRECSYADSAAYVAELLKPSGGASSPRWRAYESQDQVYSGEAGRLALTRIASTRRIADVMIKRTVFGNPLALVYVLAFMPFYLLSVLLQRRRGRADADTAAESPEETISSAVDATARVEPAKASVGASLVAVAKGWAQLRKTTPSAQAA